MFTDLNGIRQHKCKFPFPPLFDNPDNAAEQHYIDVPRPEQFQEWDTETAVWKPARSETPQFTLERIVPRYAPRNAIVPESEYENVSLINRVWKGPRSQYNGSDDTTIRMPTPEELHRYWRYLPTTVQVPNIRMYYEMRMARYEDPDYYNTADERQTSQRRAHFADDNQRPRYRSR